jgi:hypothetical protein
VADGRVFRRLRVRERLEAHCRPAQQEHAGDEPRCASRSHRA